MGGGWESESGSYFVNVNREILRSSRGWDDLGHSACGSHAGRGITGLLRSDHHSKASDPPGPQPADGPRYLYAVT